MCIRDSHSTGRGVHSAGSSVGDDGNSVMNRQDSLISTPGLVDKASPTSSRCLSGDVGMERCKQIPEIVASSKQQRSRCISPIMLKDAGIDENDVGTIRYNRVSEPILPLEDRERRKSPMMIYVSPYLPMVVWVLILDYICLLYTSPSPRDATLSRMPSSA